AHPCPVRTAAPERDLLRDGKETRLWLADAGHDARGQPPLQELDDRVDGARAVATDGAPTSFGHARHVDLDLVNLGPAHPPGHCAGRHLQIDDRSVSHVRPPPREAIAVIAVAFQILTPGFAPERPRDLSAVKEDR